MNTLSQELARYTGAIALDRFMSRRIRKSVFFFSLLVIVVLSVILCGYVLTASIEAGVLVFTVLFDEARSIFGGFLVVLSPFLFLLGATAYYNTLYFRGVRMVTKEELIDGQGITFDVARVIDTERSDLTKAFLQSSYGRDILARAGISAESIPEFLSSARERLDPLSLPIELHSFTTLSDVGRFIYEHDTVFKEFLFRQGVTEEIFSGASEWVSRARAVFRYRARWWSRDNLGKKQGVGREFSYGVAYELSKYMRSIQTTSVLSVMLKDVAYASEVINRIELVLTRSRSANVILIGEPGAGEMDILIELGRRMRDGESLASLGGKRLVVFDTNAFIATHTTKEDFEIAFLSMMSGAERAGNIIIVIENLPTFIASVHALGTDVSELMNRFLASPFIQIVSTADQGSFHAELELHQTLLRSFEQILVENPDLMSTVRVLEEAVWQYEHRHGLRFTYPAIIRIAECADQYIVDGVMPDKALRLLADIASRGAQEHHTLIRGEFVDTCVSASLGVPVGPVLGTERALLLNLEKELHTRVIGQDNALSAIAGAMRRARAGIQSKKRPIGSFLFLGSTGVGKTETAKALAALFFGSEEKMVRFDMSEFSGEEGLPRLLGTTTHAGALASALHEHPYCVLLLDELEKAHQEVHDLFLQVLDEGVFTDARGTRINARNTIIIATSNAGSGLIWTLTQAGKRPQDERDAIIDTIISERIFRPELINRFDATIIFASLTHDEQKNIARLMLRELQERVKKRGYTLVVNGALLDVLMREGYDPEFGARPMRRAIQDIIEERIATKIIEGGLRGGESIEFTERDFSTVTRV